jgi:hypothetical protein
MCTAAGASEPQLETTGDDFDRTVRSIMRYVDWLLRNPRPALLDNVYERSCDCYQRSFQELDEMAVQGWRLRSRDVHVVSVGVTGRPASNVAVVEVVNRQDGALVVVDRNGREVEHDEGWAPRRDRDMLTRAADGRWRIAEVIDN